LQKKNSGGPGFAAETLAFSQQRQLNNSEIKQENSE